MGEGGTTRARAQICLGNSARIEMSHPARLHAHHRIKTMPKSCFEARFMAIAPKDWLRGRQTGSAERRKAKTLKGCFRKNLFIGDKWCPGEAILAK